MLSSFIVLYQAFLANDLLDCVIAMYLRQVIVRTGQQ